MQQQFGRIAFTAGERRRLAASMRRINDARHFRRVQAVWLVAEGFRTREVAVLLGASQRWVNKWVARYRQRRRSPEALSEGIRSGRPALGAAIACASILALLRCDPLKLGYASSIWTVPLIRTHLREHFGCELSECTLHRRLHAAGLRWKRPRYVFAQKEPNRAQKKGGSFAD
jgi:transposase